MLVLRRRSQEVIVFEGGLTLTVLELVDHKAWLGLDAPSLARTLALAPLAVSETTVTLGVRSPAAVIYGPGTTHVELDLARDADDRRAVLSLCLEVGERVEFPGLSLEVGPISNGRAALGLDVACLGRRVAVSVHSVSGVEARIGIDAPDDIRVVRKELWLEMVGANEAASQWSTEDLGAFLAPKGPTTAP